MPKVDPADGDVDATEVEARRQLLASATPEILAAVDLAHRLHFKTLRWMATNRLHNHSRANHADDLRACTGRSFVFLLYVLLNMP